MILSNSHGIGDFVMMESTWTESQRDSFEELWHSLNTPQTDGLRHLLEACPRYANVKHRYLSYPTERRHGVVCVMANAGILHRLKFTGSTFLKETLATLSFDLPERFDFVNVTTPMNTPGVRKHRDIKPEEWLGIVKRLDERDTVGVVVSNKVEEVLPESDRLIDLRGKTTMPQAVEVLKRASGYLGIDSCFAVLASQLFGHDDLLIRTANPTVVEERWSYYPPHETIGFLTPEIGKPRYPSLPRPHRPEDTIVELRCNALVGIRTHGRGERVELPRERAEAMIAADQAIPFTLEED